jgi:hypothetical protein
MSPVEQKDERPPSPAPGSKGRTYICAICHARFSTFTAWCPDCGADKGLYLVQDKFARGRGGFQKVSGIEQEFTEHYNAGDWSPVFPEGVPGRCILLMRGKPGSGKTRLAMKLATCIGRAGMLSMENPKTKVAEMVKGVGVDPDEISVDDGQEFNEHKLKVAERSNFDALVIDSIQYMGTKPSQYYDALKAYAGSGEGGRVLIVISQTNAKGGTKGGRDAEFNLATIVADVSRTEFPGMAMIEIEKNQHGPPGRFKSALVPGTQRLTRMK